MSGAGLPEAHVQAFAELRRLLRLVHDQDEGRSLEYLRSACQGLAALARGLGLEPDEGRRKEQDVCFD